jgi:hypothetical protein
VFVFGAGEESQIPGTTWQHLLLLWAEKLASRLNFTAEFRPVMSAFPEAV